MSIITRLISFFSRPTPAAPAPVRVMVDSSVIKSVLYQENTLEVEFKSGRVYRYSDVSPETYASLVSADSVGRYFNAYIRNAHPVIEIDQ